MTAQVEPTARDAGMSSALRVLRVFEVVAEYGPIRVGELATRMGISKSTAQRCLVTLAAADWIAATDASTTGWSVSSRARIVLGSSRTESDLRDAALPAMRDLRDLVDETVHLSVRIPQHRIAIVSHVESTRELRSIAPIGLNMPEAAAASGIAMLAADPPPVAAAAIHTAFDTGDINAETMARATTAVEEARVRGYAVLDAPSGESVAVGAAIRASPGHAIGAVTVIVPITRFPYDDPADLGRAVHLAATRISLVTTGAVGS